ncbi:hypothetical protein LTR37_003453 [Vermiconidia calcicola]|uniref:Uncharacterized protein n=1 Tax=Vermiconidia calcicola TaxID=1690605 RepID=A0ACC3NPW3_9PEZI|nr:hypothetical protein LTR37_003453 [Vermiconidia calcicola]
MGCLWYLFVLSFVNALPNKVPTPASSLPLSNFCDVVVDGTTVVGACEATAKPLQARQANDFCDTVVSGETVVGVCETTFANLAGLTVISNANGAITLSLGATAPVTATFSNGEVNTVNPLNVVIETTNGAGETVISNGEGAITLPTGLTSPIETRLPNGEPTTITPVPAPAATEPSSGQEEEVIVTTNSQGNTLISNIDGIITLPTGVATPLITTFPGGETTTIGPNELITLPTALPSSDIAGAILFPVTISVPAPKPTDGGVIVPCDFFWFWNLCPKLDDISIFGWFIRTPPGIQPPGPPPVITPPVITIGPGAEFSISLPAPLPTWPQWTLPPNGIPTAEPKPDNCETETADLCFYETAFSTITSDQVTTITSDVQSTCTTVFGCNVEGTSTSTSTTESSAPGTMTWAIYPSDGANLAQVLSISNQLKELVPDPSSIYSSNTETFGLNYWLVPLDLEGSEKAKAISDVGLVWLNCGDTCAKEDQGDLCVNPCYDPTIALMYDDLEWANYRDLRYLGPEGFTKIRNQLKYLSWPPSAVRAPEKFVFDDTAGRDIPVYILDTGANLGKPEFDTVRENIRWLPSDAPHDDRMTLGRQHHGTAMLSLVAGQTLGIAKNVKPIVVRVPLPTQADLTERQLGMSPQLWIEYLSKINDDLGTQRSSEARCVVLLAEYFPRWLFPDNNPNGWDTRLYFLLLEMISKGAVIVTGSGNMQPASAIIDGWPANFGKRTTENEFTNIPSLVVAGAISGNGEITGYAQDDVGGIPHVYAPGISVLVADGALESESSNDYRSTQAAAYTAGLAAYFIRLAKEGNLKHPDGSPVENSPQGIKDFIVNGRNGNPAGSAWSRMIAQGQERPGIFNAVDVSEPQCRYRPSGSDVQRRQDSAASCISGQGSPTSVQSTSIRSTTEPTPTQPLEIQPVVCHDESDFPGHWDIAESAVSLNAFITCGKWIDEDLDPIENWHLSRTVKTNEINYQFDVEWLTGCITTVSSQSPYSPLGADADSEDQCTSILYDCWKKCDNTGVGGFIDVGCLRYTFTGGNGDD